MHLLNSLILFVFRSAFECNYEMTGDVSQNPTLEHYTRYKVSELRTTVFALQELQMNTSGCTLNAIREKYRQPKVNNY